MLRRAVAAATLLLTAGAAAAECKFEIKPSTTTGAFGPLAVYNFGRHWELQVETPTQGPLSDLTFSIDGESQRVFPGPGLDDLLFTISTDETDLQLSEAFLDKLAAGAEVQVTAQGDGRPESAAWPLKGSAAALKRLRSCR